MWLHWLTLRSVYIPVLTLVELCVFVWFIFHFTLWHFRGPWDCVCYLGQPKLQFAYVRLALCVFLFVLIVASLVKRVEVCDLCDHRWKNRRAVYYAISHTLLSIDSTAWHQVDTHAASGCILQFQIHFVTRWTFPLLHGTKVVMYSLLWRLSNKKL